MAMVHEIITTENITLQSPHNQNKSM